MLLTFQFVSAFYTTHVLKLNILLLSDLDSDGEELHKLTAGRDNANEVSILCVLSLLIFVGFVLPVAS